MFQNDVFEQKWKVVEETFQKLRNINVLPLTIVAGKDKRTVTEESLQEQIGIIHDEMFTISVCGQVKAGKSTLLNSLFFGDDVLPVFDTPMTAKLTFLEYKAGASGFEAEFYSKEEWDELCSCMKEEGGDAWKELEERCRYCAEEFGVWESQWIGHAPVSCSDLEDLAQYVSVPKSAKTGTGSCGKFTPYVKQVRIHLPYENLKNLRIVDTPGLNDSNIINSKQTTEWVKNAHAVVYVLDVTGAHKPDIEFFQKYFPSSAPEARIFVQNKIDADPDAASVKDAIRRYGKQDIYRDLGLFGENETICSYSALLALRQSKIKSGKQPSEAENLPYKDLDWIDEDFDPDPDHLEEQISRKLYQRSGCIRISRTMGEFIDLAQEKWRQITAEKEEKKAQILACSMDEQKLNDRISKLKEFCVAIDNVTESAKQNADQKIHQTIEKLKEACRERNDKIRNRIGLYIDSQEDTKTILARLPSEFMSHIRKNYALLSDDIVTTKRDLHGHLDNQKEELLNLARKYNCYEDLLSAKYIETDYGKQIDGSLEKISDFSTNLVDKLPNWFTDIFTKMSTVRNRAFSCADDALEVLFKEFQTICESLKDQFVKQLHAYLNDVATWANNRRKNLEEVKAQSSQKKDLQEQYRQVVEELEKQAETLTQNINELKGLKNSILPNGE